MALIATQRQLFEKLHTSRLEDLKTFQKKDYRGIWASIIDKYPETAHFVYELLQNADDAEATDVHIIVKTDELLFIHNGTKHFDITPEGADPAGDINSITGIGDSSKDSLSNKIGKFGVGFKAVFQYTETPEIYDDYFKFKIENYIVPCLLEYDHPNRKDGETLFVFPFKNPKEAYKDIIARLNKLDNPLLFLRHIQTIRLQVFANNSQEAKESFYSKELIIHNQWDDGISLDRYRLHQPNGERNIFLFSREVTLNEEGEGKESNHTVYVGFYYDEAKRRLITDTTQNIYCFFPTKETFKTCFVSHAPFLLTDNRQNLKPGNKWNNKLIKLIAQLAAAAVVKLRDYGLRHNNLLIDENITEILPIYHKNYYWSNYEQVFEEPIINAFNDILKNEPLFISRKKKYLFAQDAYLTTPLELRDLLTVEQFNELRGRDNEIDFVKLELQQHLRNIKSEPYYTNIREYKSEFLAKHITPSFMEHQDRKWVTKFYTYLRNYAPVLWKADNNNYKQDEQPFRFAPIIKTQNNEWVAPNQNSTTLNVFYPLSNQPHNDEYNYIHQEYLNDPIAKKFFDELGVKTPDDFDYIKSVILPKYAGETIKCEQEEINEHLEVLINYYKKIKDDGNCSDHIKLISESLWICSDDDTFRTPDDLFWENDKLDKYYDHKIVYYVNQDYYKEAIGRLGLSTVKDFFLTIGVRYYPALNHHANYDASELNDRLRSHFTSANYSECKIISDYELDYFHDSAVKHYITKEISVYLWNEVLPALKYNNYGSLTARYREKYARTYKETTYTSSFKDELIYSDWIYDNSDNITSPIDISLEDLAPEYNRNNGLIQFLDIKKNERSIIELGGTNKQQDTYELGKKLQDEFGGVLTQDEMISALRQKAAEKNAQVVAAPKTQIPKDNTSNEQHKENNENENQEENLDSKLKRRWEEKANQQNKRPRPAPKDNDLVPFEANKHNNAPSNNGPFFDDVSERPNIVGPTDEQNQNAVKSLTNKNNEAQELAQKTSEQVEILEKLQDTPKYTFLWYKLLMELMHADKSQSTSRLIEIIFTEWSFECSNKILRLSNPITPIPSWLVDSESISITALSEKPKRIDGTVVKSEERSIDISIEYSTELQELCNKTKKIKVVAENSNNIIDSLERRFLQLGYEDDYNLNDNLTKDIQFIYGPPGTGKTTYLVNLIRNIIEGSKDRTNILVLTPTNKAADVIAEKMVDDDVCYDFLTRYGATESTYLIEDAAVVLNRDTLDMDLLDNNIVVATAVRYTYDCLQPDNVFICDYSWDYIIIDEASMIDILTVTYILHKGANSKIIIAGDPKQIQPVSQNNMPSYNIYDMVGLCEFSDAINNYSRYPVTALITQYRSIPVIGDVVSSFAYGGYVKPYSDREPQKPLVLDGIKTNDVNFLGFDIVDLDLIKGVNSIEDSAFHLYSVIFTYNLAEYIANQVNKKYPQTQYSIGIVCPYKKQADAIAQMLKNRSVDTNNCVVKCGTVHSFQGDECDIMMIVLNPPYRCSANSHINNVNILNVAMSRARDYLFFILPYGQTPGFFQKSIIGKCVDIAHRSILRCEQIEDVIFGSHDFIINNTHVTCHMPVNVYKDSDALYEVRLSDEALDIKINK